jgi:hypothetical protein
VGFYDSCVLLYPGSVATLGCNIRFCPMSLVESWNGHNIFVYHSYGVDIVEICFTAVVRSRIEDGNVNKICVISKDLRWPNSFREQ